MPAYTQIVREMSEAKFQEVFGVSIRKARETYLARHNIKAPKSVKKTLRAGAKNEARVVALFAHLKTVDDDQMVEEILRTWLSHVGISWAQRSIILRYLMTTVSRNPTMWISSLPCRSMSSSLWSKRSRRPHRRTIFRSIFDLWVLKTSLTRLPDWTEATASGGARRHITLA